MPILDLIDAYFDCTPSLVTESWHPLSTEPPIHPHAFAFNTSYMTAETRERLKNQRPGYASNLIDVCAKERPQYHRGAYKYNTVPTSSKALSTSGRLAHLLAHSGSVILLVSSQYSYHFSARLQPWVHYVPISYSMADLKERVQWLQEHDDLAQQIAENARNFARSFLRMEDYYCFAAAAMDSAAKSYKSIDSLKAFHPKLVKEDNCCCCQW